MQKLLPHTLSLVHVAAGHVIPDTFLNKLNTENRSAFGFVVRENGAMVIEKFDQLNDLDKELKLQTTILSNTKKYDRLFTYGAFPSEFDEDEVQPFVALKDSKDRPILVIGIEGDFPQTKKNPEGFSDNYVVFQEWLKPKLETMFKFGGNNVGKVVDYLKTDDFLNDFKHVMGHRGVIAVMPMTGQPFMVGQNELGEKFNWGEASIAYGYTESANAAATPAAPAAAEKPPATKRVSRYADDVIEEIEKSDQPELPITEPPAAPVKEPEKQPDKRPAPTPPEELHEVNWKPPANFHGKRLKKAYRDVLGGDLPDNWYDRPTVLIKTKKNIKDFKELDQTAAAPLAQAASVAAAATAQNAARPADVTSALPVVSGAQQAAGVDFIKKHLSDSKALNEDPLETQKREAKLALFSELVLESDLDRLERWPTSGIFAFVKANPELAALAIIELRRDRINRKATLAAVNPKLGELTGTAPAGTSTEQKSETASTNKVSKYA